MQQENSKGNDAANEVDLENVKENFNEKQKRNTQIQGQVGVITALNNRLFMIKRLRNFIGKMHC